jgi:hypothetical protein
VSPCSRATREQPQLHRIKSAGAFDDLQPMPVSVPFFIVHDSTFLSILGRGGRQLRIERAGRFAARCGWRIKKSKQGEDMSRRMHIKFSLCIYCFDSLLEDGKGMICVYS